MENKNGDLDITFIKDLKSVTKRGWTNEKATKFCERLRDLSQARTPINVIYETLAKELKMSTAGVSAFKAELTRASKQGFTSLQSYLNAGRPCTSGKEEIKT